MNTCKKCLYPDTKPDLTFDAEGVCSACNNYQERKNIDWNLQKTGFLDIVERFRSKSTNYDCIIPVSGGKDSTYQVLRVKECGLTPLCITATTDSLSEIGRRNLNNIRELGVDLIEVSVNPLVRRRLNRFCLREVGDISWPEHVTIFTIPVRAAVQMGIRLIVWGENPQNEYGGPAAAAKGNTLDRRWLEEFGGLLGLRTSDLVGVEGIQEDDLIQYTYPSDEELSRSGVTGVFLGAFFPWDGFQNAIYAQAYGFETSGNFVEGSLSNYENLDNHQTGIHDYFKFLKYGFGRATDIANNHIRRGRLERQDAATLVSLHDGRFPWTCLGRPIDQILDEIDVSFGEFIDICDNFTNKKIFQTDNAGKVVRNENFDVLKRE